MSTIQDFTGYTPTWCSGCGNFSIGRAIMMSLTEQQLKPDSTMMLFDIGCSGNMNDFVNAYAMHTLHGRSIANGIGVKLSNHKMPVLVVGGDGALYGEGGNHFLHACRGNHDMTVIVHDNRVYGLTKGQVAPTSQEGYKSKTTPDGIIENSVNALVTAVANGATFVAQGFSGNLPQLSQLITAGMQHKGFSIINVLQPCVTFNKVNTYGYYFQNAYQLKDHNPEDYWAAMQVAQQPMDEKFPLGLIYQRQKPAYHERVAQLEQEALVHQNSTDSIKEIKQLFL